MFYESPHGDLTDTWSVRDTGMYLLWRFSGAYFAFVKTPSGVAHESGYNEKKIIFALWKKAANTFSCSLCLWQAYR